MAVTTEKCGEIQNLRAMAKGLRGASVWWSEKYASDPHCDKKHFGFRPGAADRGLAAFTATVNLEAYAGYYGSSSVSRVLSLDDKLIGRYFAAALNQHRQAIFDTIAELAENDASKLVAEAREELSRITDMLEEAELGAEPAESAPA
tara:strand:+ start:580 stop:1020 length:441 start_codon:yes stop_codon:yes gene_type:complete